MEQHEHGARTKFPRAVHDWGKLALVNYHMAAELAHSFIQELRQSRVAFLSCNWVHVRDSYGLRCMDIPTK